MINKIPILIILLVLVTIANSQAVPEAGCVAFSQLTGDYWQIWTMQPDGTNFRQITRSPLDKRYPAWSSDGGTIFFRTNNNQAFSCDTETGEEKQIFKGLGWICGLEPAPDTNECVLVRLQAGIKDRGDLWLVDLDNGANKVLVRDKGLQYDPEWSPDGRQIIYVSQMEPENFELYVINVNGQNKKRLTYNRALELLPTFSPDGKTVAYVSNITGDYEIWLMNSDGTNSIRLTNSEGIDTKPCWSPDGGNIMFVSSRSGDLRLWIMNSDGSNPRPLRTIPPSIDPVWRK